MFLRLKLRKTGEYAMINMSHVIRVEFGDESDPENPWCKLIHFPEQPGADGRPLLSKTEIAMSFDEVSMLLSGRWMTDPM
ncbi:MAG: hypothetical protein GKR98_08785 [Boseongicola sp.]|nr:MAG: hypothetical protein GKR98_08785 [Boseongicola sp.]